MRRLQLALAIEHSGANELVSLPALLIASILVANIGYAKYANGGIRKLGPKPLCIRRFSAIINRTERKAEISRQSGKNWNFVRSCRSISEDAADIHSVFC